MTLFYNLLKYGLREYRRLIAIIAAKTLFIILLCAVLAFFISYISKRWPKYSTFLTIIKLLLLLTAGYALVYLFFFYKIGLPPVDGLDDSDWLSFLSGYLTFSGSLIMAWLVFTQSRDINNQNTLLNNQSRILNELTLQEYRIVLKGVIEFLELREFNEKELNKWTIIPRICENNQESYFKYDLIKKDISEIDYTSTTKYYLFFKLYNFSKLTIENFKIRQVCFRHSYFENENNSNKELCYSVYDGREASVFNGTHIILPNDWVPICLVLPSVDDFDNEIAYRFEVFVSYKVDTQESENHLIFTLYRNNNLLTVVDEKKPLTR